MPTYRVLVKGKVLSITNALSARHAAVIALEADVSAAEVSILSGKTGKHPAARFTREELARDFSLMAHVDGELVRFKDKYQQITLVCRSAEHASLIARAIVNGAIKFTSKAE